MKTKEGHTPLTFAVKRDDLEIVQTLLGQPNCDVNTRFLGHTPLMVAANCGHTRIVRLLMQRPEIDINAVDGRGFTALHYAF